MNGVTKRIVVLNDETTFSGIEGARVVDILVPHGTQDETTFIEEALQEGTTESCRDVSARWIVTVGNPFDGFTIYGPFDSSDDATYWAEHNRDGDNWWLQEIKEPA